MRNHCREAHLAALFLAFCLAGSTASCDLVNPCGESRYADAMIEADFTGTGAVEGALSLLDSRNDSYDQFSWLVLFAPTNSADSLVTDVHLHETATGDILHTLPVSMERSDPANPDRFAWIVSDSESSLYRGSVPFERFYDLVSRSGTYVDVHTVAHPSGARGRVPVGQSSGWVQYCD